MAKRHISLKDAADTLGVTAKWVRRQIDAGVVNPARAGNKRNGRFLFSDVDVATLAPLAHERTKNKDKAIAPSETTLAETDAIERIGRLEADRANLIAQVAWERAIAQEQAKALEFERVRTDKLSAELETQRARVEELKALTAWDRVRGRHKAI